MHIIKENLSELEDDMLQPMIDEKPGSKKGQTFKLATKVIDEGR